MTTNCLVIIDLLNGYLAHWDSERRTTLIAATNRVVHMFRRRGRPIIWIRQEFRADLSDAFLEMRDREISVCIEGTAGAEIDPGLDWRPDDLTLVKKRYSAFFGTDLDEVLKRLGIEEVVICGINTHACVRMTAIDCYQRDLRVILVADCVDSYDMRHAEVSLAYMKDKIARVMTLDDLAAQASAEDSSATSPMGH